MRISSEVSGLENVVYGVPQGLILGPALLNIYLNDLNTMPHFSSLESYMDNSKLYVLFPIRDVNTYMSLSGQTSWCGRGNNQYISITDPLLNNSELKLLIRFWKPHRAVSKGTDKMGEINPCITGIDVTGFATHSTPEASTSYSVNKAGLGLAQVLKPAACANGSYL